MAGNHGVILWGRTEFGFASDPVMVKLNLIFAATRIQIQMDRYPKWCIFRLVSFSESIIQMMQRPTPSLLFLLGQPPASTRIRIFRALKPGYSTRTFRDHLSGLIPSPFTTVDCKTCVYAVEVEALPQMKSMERVGAQAFL